ncbi:hypothetical protein B0H11DRAFT_2187821 [Mycena galericulata]|nr:hypothetical protein B0H11DRAFT_2187821 [Mycena galericulata]
MAAAGSQSPSLSELFDLTVEVPRWVSARVASMDIASLSRNAEIGLSMWHCLVYEVFFDEAGIMPSGVMTGWRQILTDNKITHARVARALGLSHQSNGVKENLLLCCLLYTISMQGTDEPAAMAWLRLLLQPTILRVKQENAARTRSPVADDEPPTRVREVLGRYRQLSRRAVSELESREDNPYGLPKDPSLISIAHLDPGQAMVVRMLVEPTLSASLLAVAQGVPELSNPSQPRTPPSRKRGRSAETGVAGPSRAPLYDLSPMSIPQTHLPRQSLSAQDTDLQEKYLSMAGLVDDHDV